MVFAALRNKSTSLSLDKKLAKISNELEIKKIRDIKNKLLAVVNYCSKISFGLSSIRIESFIQNFVVCVAEVESRTQGLRPRPRLKKIRGQGQGQECSRPRPRTQMQVFSSEKRS